MNYLDASALVKRYVSEPGRHWVEHQLRSVEAHYTSAISYAEVHAALARRYWQGDLKHIAFRRARTQFERDWLQLQEIAVDNDTMGPVRVLVQRVRLRGMDAIHLAAAVWLTRRFGHAPRFISSDPRLIQAARQFGFAATDPVEAEGKAP